MKPLVSVITATHNRHEKLAHCVESVRAQDYEGPIEHIIVSDGPDPGLWKSLPPNVDKHLRKTEVYATGRNWHQLSGLSWGGEPRTVGMFMASGDYICVVDDDDTVTPDHVSSLVDALHGTEHWFSLCKFEYPDGRILGNGTIAPSMVGTPMILFRPECLTASVMRPGSYLGDFEWIARMAERGMTWGFTDKATYKVGHVLELVGSEA